MLSTHKDLDTSPKTWLRRGLDARSDQYINTTGTLIVAHLRSSTGKRLTPRTAESCTPTTVGLVCCCYGCCRYSFCCCYYYSYRFLLLLLQLSCLLLLADAPIAAATPAPKPRPSSIRTQQASRTTGEEEAQRSKKTPTKTTKKNTRIILPSLPFPLSLHSTPLLSLPRRLTA